VVLAVTAACVVACLVGAGIYVDSILAPGRGRLGERADDLKLPPDLVVAHESTTGNRICLEECVTLTRIYVSRLPAETTAKIVVTALGKAGYRCVIAQTTTTPSDGCRDRGADLQSDWTRETDGFHLSVHVHPIPGNWAYTMLSGISVDPACQSFVAMILPG
jgi:hypothetical protein